MIVLDASAAIEVLLQTAVGAPLAERLLRSAATLHAPYLIDVALTEALGATLLTCDGRIPLAPGHSAKVEVVKGTAAS